MSSQDPVPVEETTVVHNHARESPNWSRSTKVIVTVITLLVAFGLTYRFQALISLVVIAAILAYIMNPVIDLIDRHTMFSRSTGILLMYLIFAFGFIYISVALGVAAFEQVTTLITAIPRLITQVTEFFRELSLQPDPIVIGPIEINPATVDWRLIQDQVLGFVEPVVSSGTQMVTGVAAATLRIFSNLLFVFVISIYFAIEIPRLGGHIGNLAHQPGYRRDAERLMRGFGRIWSAYLRGQVVLGVIIFLVVWIGLQILGVQNALALGLLSGLLEFIPILGPFIGAGAAVIVSFFQPVTIFGLEHWQFAGCGVGLYVFGAAIGEQLSGTPNCRRCSGAASAFGDAGGLYGDFPSGYSWRYFSCADSGHT